MDINLLIPAFLCGLFCYFGGVESSLLFGMTGGFYIVGRPLVAGLLVGLVFGDVQAGVLCGLAVQGVFIANLQTGGSTNSEIAYASYGGIGLAMATTKDPAVAVALSLLIGQTFGLIFYNARMVGVSYFNHKAQTAAENLDEKGIINNHIIYPQITTCLVRAIPVFLAIYFGSDLVDWLLNNVPTVVTDIISVLGGVLPALGIAMLMNIVIKEGSHFIFFLIGFVVIAFLKVNMIGLVFFAALVAYLVYLTKQNNSSEVVNSNGINQNQDFNDYYEDDGLF